MFAGDWEHRKDQAFTSTTSTTLEIDMTEFGEKIIGKLVQSGLGYLDYSGSCV